MTNLVEKITILLTIHRDEHPQFPFDNVLQLGDLPRRGIERRGYITYEWQRHGMEEICEVEGGDN
jgi:hypothetical protein